MSELSAWLIAHHPRVTYLKRAKQCSAFKGGAPVKVYWKRDGTRQDDAALLAKWRCSKPAHWRFQSLKRSWSRGAVEVVCFHHLYFRELFGDMTETEATEKLMVKTGYVSPEQTMTQRERAR